MSLLKCMLAIENQNGENFTVCEVSTWFNMEILIAITEYSNKKGPVLNDTKKEAIAIDLYNQFGKNDDKTERIVNLAELRKLETQSNELFIIPKTKNRFVLVNEWEAGFDAFREYQKVKTKKINYFKEK